MIDTCLEGPKSSHMKQLPKQGHMAGQPLGAGFLVSFRLQQMCSRQKLLELCLRSQT